ncbi:MAG: PQQ-dependent sugar dehydrogenase [Balneolaceae bacterium]
MKHLALLAAILIGCTAAGESEQVPLNDMEYSYELVTTGVQVPWGMAWLPNGDMLITERAGKLFIYRNNELMEVPSSSLPNDIYANGQGGFLDVDVHPNYEENGWIYFTYSSSNGEGDGANTALIRAKMINDELSDIETLYKATPNTTRGQHYGSRIEFDRDGYLFLSIGDRGNRSELPQDITKDAGKIYRFMDDGSIPSDNPFVNEAGAKTAIYSYGHRNPQGMAMNPATGKIWAHEHGPRGGDELNLIEPGKNYGWPVISYGINYNGTPFAEDTARAGMEQPVTYWVPSIAPSGMTFVTGDKYPHWKGHLLVGSLKFSYIELVKLNGDKVTGTEKLVEGIGRVRSLKQAPDGTIYAGITGQGIFKIVATPVSEE